MQSIKLFIYQSQQLTVRLYQIRYGDYFKACGMCRADAGRRIFKRKAFRRAYPNTFACFQVDLRVRLCMLYHVPENPAVKVLPDTCIFELLHGVPAA